MENITKDLRTMLIYIAAQSNLNKNKSLEIQNKIIFME